MAKQKYSDEQLIELLVSPEYEGKNNTEVAGMIGMAYDGKLSARLNQLRKNAGLPVSGRGGDKRSGKSKHIGNGKGPIDINTLPDADCKPPESIAAKQELIPFPFAPKDLVIFDGRLHTVQENCLVKLVMYENATLRRKTVALEDWNRNPDMVKSTERKPEHRYEDVSRDYPPRSIEELFERIPTSESPVKDLDGRKPATINQDFEDAFKPKPAEKTKFEQVAERMKNEQPAVGPVEPPERHPGCGHSPDQVVPAHSDQQVDDSSSKAWLLVASDPEDYPDPEWFKEPIPRKGTVERAIWDRAYEEICEIQTLRSTLRKALDYGSRLPSVYVDSYNKYVSKYCKEVAHEG